MQGRFEIKSNDLKPVAESPLPISTAPKLLLDRALIHRDRMVDMAEEARVQAETFSKEGWYTQYYESLEQMQSLYQLMCWWSPETRQEVITLLQKVAVETEKRAKEVKEWEGRLATVVGPAEKTTATLDEKLSRYERIKDQKRILINAVRG